MFGPAKARLFLGLTVASVSLHGAIVFSLVAASAPGGLTQDPGNAPSLGLAEAPGLRTMRARCIACHDADIIREQRLSKPAWGREVDKMIGWGAEVSATEKDEIIDYLSGQFKAIPLAFIAPEDDQAAVGLLSRCLVCHDLRLIEAQRLTGAGWTREIDKMIAWGASLTESERDVLSKYLVIRFGPAK